MSETHLQTLVQRLGSWLKARDLTPDPVPLFCQFEQMAGAEDIRLGDIRELADAIERLSAEQPKTLSEAEMRALMAEARHWDFHSMAYHQEKREAEEAAAWEEFVNEKLRHPTSTPAITEER